MIAREGLETYLIAILALASTGGNLKQQRVIWGAIIASFIATLGLAGITAQFLGSHANIERFEGVIGVFTGIILAWVAWFCHGAAQHVKHLPLHNAWLLGLAVFGIVFREGVEELPVIPIVVKVTMMLLRIHMHLPHFHGGMESRAVFGLLVRKIAAL